MIETTEADTIRNHIAAHSESLSATLNYLWNISKTLHDLQNDADGTQNGREHVKAVEHNIWRLITETERLDAFNINELFLLSAAACCHDFGKALRKFGTGSFPRIFRHGSNSADFLQNNSDVLGFIEHKHLAQDVSRIIEIHDLNGDRFAEEVKKLKRKRKATSFGTIRHRLLAVLLKAADTLHTDYSRTQKLGGDLSGLTDRQKSTCLARNCISGWDQNGNRLTIQATVTTEEEKNAIVACKSFMLKDEWPVVGECLENYDFPHILKFEIEDRLNKEEEPMPATNDDQTVDDIPVGQDRFLATEATDVALNIALGHVERFPLCRNLASSHAAGAAVVGLAVRVMRNKLQGLKNTFKNYRNEMFLEKKGYAPRNLAEHIGWLAEQDALVSRILDDGPDGPESEALKKIFENLPDINVLLYEPLGKLRRSLKQHMHEMRVPYKTITKEIKDGRPTPEQVNQQIRSMAWEGVIRDLFDSKWPALFALLEDIETIIKDVDKISHRTNIDWQRDVNQIWDAESRRHRPRHEKKLA